jgi:ribose transport system substrate-binding protein
MIRTRLTSVLLPLLSVIVLTGGCARKPTDDQVVIGVSLLTREHVFYRDLEEALIETAAKYNYKLNIAAANFDAARQTAQVEDFIVQKVDAMVVSPCNSASIGRSIEDANRAGIPVFTADIAADEGEVVSHIASDNVAGGRLAGEYLAKALNYRGNIVIIDAPITTSVLDRVQGFLEVIQKYPDMQVLDRPNAEGQRVLALKAMEDMLQAYPDIDGVFGINDDSALGALAAIEASGKYDIVVVGYDATPDAVDAIRRGSPLKADVIQYPKKIGSTTIETIHHFLNGETVPKVIPVEVGIVDKAALEQGR